RLAMSAGIVLHLGPRATGICESNCRGTSLPLGAFAMCPGLPKAVLFSAKAVSALFSSMPVPAIRAARRRSVHGSLALQDRLHEFRLLRIVRLPVCLEDIVVPLRGRVIRVRLLPGIPWKIR